MEIKVMRTTGFVIAVIGGLIAFITSMIFGLIILGLGLIVISLNKSEQMKIKEQVIVKHSEKKSGYFYWSKTKLGSWSMPVDVLVILAGSALCLLLFLLCFAFLTENSDSESMKDLNCGTSIIYTDYFLNPIFKYDGLYLKFCGGSK